MLVNISHGTRLVIPIILEILCCIFLMQAIFTRVKWPDTIQQKIFFTYFFALIIVVMIYKLHFFSQIKRKLLLFIQKNQQSKEYVLELLQEGILILSSNVVKDQRGKVVEPGKSLSFIHDNLSKDHKNDHLKMEYVNEKFKEILRINGEISPSTDINGTELLNSML